MWTCNIPPHSDETFYVDRQLFHTLRWNLTGTLHRNLSGAYTGDNMRTHFIGHTPQDTLHTASRYISAHWWLHSTRRTLPCITSEEGKTLQVLENITASLEVISTLQVLESTTASLEVSAMLQEHHLGATLQKHRLDAPLQEPRLGATLQQIVTASHSS